MHIVLCACAALAQLCALLLTQPRCGSQTSVSVLAVPKTTGWVVCCGGSRVSTLRFAGSLSPPPRSVFDVFWFLGVRCLFYCAPLNGSGLPSLAVWTSGSGLSLPLRDLSSPARASGLSAVCPSSKLCLFCSAVFRLSIRVRFKLRESQQLPGAGRGVRRPERRCVPFIFRTVGTFPSSWHLSHFWLC